MMRDSDRMFLNLDDLRNVPQYPGYPGYQLFATLIFLILKKCTCTVGPGSGEKVCFVVCTALLVLEQTERKSVQYFVMRDKYIYRIKSQSAGKENLVT